MTTTCFDKCTNASYLISNCILQLLCDSKIVYEINLSDLIIVDGVNSSLDIYSGTTFITNLSSDELAALGLTRAILEAERTACNCCLAGAEETDLFAPSAYTPLCDSANPNLYYLAYFILVNGVKENHYITMPSGVDTTGDLPATAIPCKEPKVITSCYNANGVLYTNIICLSGSTVIGTLWLNMTDNSVSATMPVGAAPCKEIKVIAVEPHCATRQVNNGTPFYLAYKGSYADYINAGGDPNAIDLGTFAPPYEGWLYAGICATSLPNPINGWEWTDIASPILATNSGNTYGPLTLVSNGNILECINSIERKSIEKIKYSDGSIQWVEDNPDRSLFIDFDVAGWVTTEGSCILGADHSNGCIEKPTEIPIPAYKVVTYGAQGNVISVNYYKEGTTIEVPFDPITDKFKPECKDPLPLEIGNGITYTNNLAENNPQPSIVKSITLTKQSGGIVEVSFDSGATYPLRLVANGSRTWGQGNQEGLDVANMRFKQLTNGIYDLIWEI